MKSRILLAAAAVLALSACKPAVTEAPPPASAPPAAKPPAPAGKVIPLTSEGFGALKIGMTEAEASTAIGGFKDGEASAECHERAVMDASLGLVVMFEEGRISRISAGEGSHVQTDHALAVGATEAAVRAAYPDGLIQEPHKYLMPPAKRLTHWDKAPVRGVLYEIGEKQTVIGISAGGPSIQYVEGCS
jgi:hypothetical protein